ATVRRARPRDPRPAVPEADRWAAAPRLAVSTYAVPLHVPAGRRRAEKPGWTVTWRARVDRHLSCTRLHERISPSRPPWLTIDPCVMMVVQPTEHPRWTAGAHSGETVSYRNKEDLPMQMTLTRRTFRALPALFLAGATALQAQTAVQGKARVTTPEEFFGHTIGADYVLPNYTQFAEYWRRLDAESDRIKVVSIGKTA